MILLYYFPEIRLLPDVPRMTGVIDGVRQWPAVTVSHVGHNDPQPLFPGSQRFCPKAMAVMKVLLHRVHDHALPDSSACILVPIWPRGITKAAINWVAWLNGIAPSNDLRKWFDHDIEKWTEFQKRYAAELVACGPLALLPELPTAHDMMVFLYAAKNLVNGRDKEGFFVKPF